MRQPFEPRLFRVADGALPLMASPLISKKTASTRAIDRIGGAMLARFIGFAHSSSSPPPLYDDHMAIFAENHPFIMAMWHGQFMLLPSTPRPGIPARVMLALHRDAEAMAEALRRFDLDLIRGAGAGVKGKDRGGAGAFRNAVHTLEQGFTVAMTADVPPGPSRRAGHGVVTLAKVSGRPILPVAIASSRFITLNTWSRMTINLPWSRLGASLGDVIYVPADATPEQLEEYRLKVERALNVATVDAYARAGVSPRRALPPRQLMEQGPLPPKFGLKAYRGIMSAGRAVVPLLLSWRERKGKELPARLGERYGIASASRPTGSLVWFHAASVGETATVLPLIEALKQARPDICVLLTTGTVSSAKLVEGRNISGLIHQFVPLDVPQYVIKFLDHWRPSLAVFVESEIWPNLILETSRRDVLIAVANARMSKGSFRSWRKRPGISHSLFGRFHTVLAQNKSYALRFTDLGSPRVVDAGNLKVDVPPLPVDASALEAFRAATAGREVWLAASTHPGEEDIAAQAHTTLKAKHPRILTVIVPRHTDRGDGIATDLRRRGLKTAQRSKGNVIDGETDIYLADTLGELGTWMTAAPITFMGKSLDKTGGGHNPIEPIRLGSVVVTGPSWHNFDDFYKALLGAHAATEVASASELAGAIDRLLTSAVELAMVRGNAERAVAAMSGGLAKSVAALLPLLPPPSDHQRQPTAGDDTLAPR